ncbi:hypothetical protein POX_d05805 [Penicillium oxalicum]|uniref:hypothetical protein n=1 Tax=Penicillium oxalicum TaxID=69781 RepID=UPI0020B6D586|nr:hypothetical protein POX_d05805 [Penicillium oxalicum]KAI2790296.1 hypothetical protein POX_d05805 [Penicillium oxalicum]
MQYPADSIVDDSMVRMLMRLTGFRRRYSTFSGGSAPVGLKPYRTEPASDSTTPKWTTTLDQVGRAAKLAQPRVGCADGKLPVEWRLWLPMMLACVFRRPDPLAYSLQLRLLFDRIPIRIANVDSKDERRELLSPIPVGRISNDQSNNDNIPSPFSWYLSDTKTNSRATEELSTVWASPCGKHHRWSEIARLWIPGRRNRLDIILWEIHRRLSGPSWEFLLPTQRFGVTRYLRSRRDGGQLTLWVITAPRSALYGRLPSCNFDGSPESSSVGTVHIARPA